MKFSRLLAALGLLFSQIAFSQSTPVQGIAQKEVETHAYTGATVHINEKESLKNATILVSKGRIVAVGAQLSIPSNAIVHNLNGRHVYPSFIELNSGYGVDIQKNEKGEYPVYDKANPGATYWNDAIRAQIDATKYFKVDEKEAEKWRKAGFGTVLSHHQDGIARGNAVFASLGDQPVNESLLAASGPAFFSFDKGSSSMSYPTSLMGSIALLKQSLHDAKWYASGADREKNISLDALAEQMKEPGFFICQDKWDAERAAAIAKEFNLNWIYIGGNDLYENPEAFANKGYRFVVPLKHPKAYDLSDPLATAMLGMEDLKAYDWAPTNLSKLEKMGIPFAISASGLEKPEELLAEIRTAIEAGLSKEMALKALFITPANFVGLSKEVGSLEKGKLANFLICSGELFHKKTQILENVVRGKAYEVNPSPKVDFEGTYTLQVANNQYHLSLSPDKDSYKAELKLLSGTDTTKLKAQVSTQGFAISISFKSNEDDNFYRLNGYQKSGREIQGLGFDPQGDRISFLATPKEEENKEEKEDEDENLYPVSTFSYPLKAFGYGTQPKAEPILIKNATVWTNEKEGILQNTDVFIAGGKITQIGKNLPTQGARVIDGTGKHLTTGIIDEHSHIAIARGVNEAGQAISAEVRIGDVVNPEDINIYRQLAGGVTAAQLLHGSANPIGGQSALVKLKYGSNPEEMKIQNADGFIKFALGENVKQSNWGDRNTTRYPQTRMGVEQIYYDAFIRAKEYQQQKLNAKSLKERPRYDMELETLLEILNKKRFVSCHSYIQSEINMLMHVADSMGFTINTFTHILEGYKVADKMAKHGASGSTFSDWWAYKFEVKDAIPYNAALMHEQGVNVGINSDDAEMGRRLNQEAAKVVKYGGVSEEEAWKMVTLNPAKMLHLDQRMGSIKLGKDADVVLWDDKPLSQQAKALYTIIDGAIYYSTEQEMELLKRDREDRQRIVQKMMEDKYDQKKKPEKAKRDPKYDCEDFDFLK
ncbi:MAG: amidohydrolase family protein [Luteibaculum sp.]